MMWGIVAYNVHYTRFNPNFLDSWKIHLFFSVAGYINLIYSFASLCFPVKNSND